MLFAVEVEMSDADVCESLPSEESLRSVVVRIYRQPNRRAARKAGGFRPHRCEKGTPNADSSEMLLNIELVEVGGRQRRGNARSADFDNGETDEVRIHFRYQSKDV
jgi:hypothetical protein